MVGSVMETSSQAEEERCVYKKFIIAGVEVESQGH